LNVDAEDFRRRYAELNDVALLDLNVDELVEVARQCYAAELARRGLHREPEAPMESPTEIELVPVGEYTLLQEGQMARMILESAGIPCRLENEYSPYVRGIVVDPALGRIRLLVAANLLEEARECLASSACDPVSDEELARQAGATSDPEAGEEGQ